MKATGHRVDGMKNDGFTLLEVMIALAIIGMTVTVILHTVNYHSDIMYENTLKTTMLQIAKEKMVELEMDNMPLKGIVGPAGITFEKTISQTSTPGISEIKATVTGHGKKITLTELIRNREIR